MLETQKSLFPMLKTDIIIFFSKCLFGSFPSPPKASEKGFWGAPAPNQVFFQSLLMMTLILTAAEAAPSSTVYLPAAAEISVEISDRTSVSFFCSSSSYLRCFLTRAATCPSNFLFQGFFLPRPCLLFPFSPPFSPLSPTLFMSGRSQVSSATSYVVSLNNA